MRAARVQRFCVLANIAERPEALEDFPAWSGGLIRRLRPGTRGCAALRVELRPVIASATVVCDARTFLRSSRSWSRSTRLNGMSSASTIILNGHRTTLVCGRPYRGLSMKIGRSRTVSRAVKLDHNDRPSNSVIALIPTHSQDRRHHVHKRHRGHLSSGLNLGPTHDERDVNQLLPHRVTMLKAVVVEQLLPVVGRQHDECIAEQTP